MRRVLSNTMSDVSVGPSAGRGAPTVPCTTRAIPLGFVHLDLVRSASLRYLGAHHVAGPDSVSLKRRNTWAVASRLMNDTGDLSLKVDSIRDTLQIMRSLLEEVTVRLARIEDAIHGAPPPADASDGGSGRQ